MKKAAFTSLLVLSSFLSFKGNAQMTQKGDAKSNLDSIIAKHLQKTKGSTFSSVSEKSDQKGKFVYIGMGGAVEAKDQNAAEYSIIMQGTDKNGNKTMDMEEIESGEATYYSKDSSDNIVEANYIIEKGADGYDVYSATASLGKAEPFNDSAEMNPILLAKDKKIGSFQNIEESIKKLGEINNQTPPKLSTTAHYSVGL